MLEGIAFKFISQSESSLNGLSYGLTVVGAVIGAFLIRSKTEMARAPYFAYSALIVFLASAAQFVWLQTFPAMAGGYLWLLVLTSVATALISGFTLCSIAKARSRDAYGHARLAALAFIPVANFWLLLTPSKNRELSSGASTPSLVTGPIGVVTGFVLLAAAAGVTGFFKQQMRQLGEQSQVDPAAQQAGVEFAIRSNGLEGALKIMAEQAGTPIKVDDRTTLARIDAEGTQLRRTIVFDVEGATMTDDMRQKGINLLCANPPFAPLFRAGATIREVYVERSGREIGSITITPQECGF